ncbi:MAG: type IV toxin-antitoxin system AbiEi family antitoxin domain-containing protein [Desulfurococcaceae archaeon]
MSHITESASSSTFSKAPYKSHHHGNPRTLPRVAKLGPLERRVLHYAARVAEVFTVADIVVYYKLKDEYGENARKRVHDAVMRLVKRGVLVKLKHGVYKLAVDLSPGDFDPENNGPGASGEPSGGEGKDILVGCSGSRRSCLRCSCSSCSCCGLGCGCGVVGVGVCFGLGRVHVRGCKSYFEFLVRLRFVKFLVDCAWFVASWYGASLFGRGFVRRAVRVALGGARVVGGVVGVHGWRGDRDRALLPLSYSSIMYFDEHGVDLLVERRGSVRVSAKVYYVPVEQLPAELYEYCESLLGSPVKLFKRAVARTAARSARGSTVAR